MMKRLLPIVSVFIMLNMVTCKGRDLSTPSNSLVGHWKRTYLVTKEKSEYLRNHDERYKKWCRSQGILWQKELHSVYLPPGEYEFHAYYSEIDKENQQGSYILLNERGDVSQHQYTVNGENKKNNTVIVSLKFKSGSLEQQTFFIEDNGQKLIRKSYIQTATGYKDFLDTLYYMDNVVAP